MGGNAGHGDDGHEGGGYGSDGGRGDDDDDGHGDDVLVWAVCHQPAAGDQAES